MSFCTHHSGSSLLTIMARFLLVLAMIATHIHTSAEESVRLTQCRDLHRSKKGEPEFLPFPAGVSCETSVQLPVIDVNGQNFTDPRASCFNFIKCESFTCQYCPCPGNMTFNPVTLRCDDTLAMCECPSTQAPTTASLSQTTYTRERPPTVRVITQPSTETTSPPKEVENGVVIIAGIVSATVLILVVLIVGFIMWNKGIFTFTKKPQMNPSSNDGYLSTLPPQERHVYAEIDDRMMSSGNRMAERHALSLPSRHQMSPCIQPPAIPLPHPPVPPSMCSNPFHRNMSARGSFPQRSYSAPMATQPGLLTVNIPDGPAQNGPPPAYDIANHGRNSSVDSSLTTCSECSHCSGLSAHGPVYSHDNIDRRTLLRSSNNNNPPPAHWNYVSKQVYI